MGLGHKKFLLSLLLAPNLSHGHSAPHRLEPHCSIELPAGKLSKAFPEEGRSDRHHVAQSTTSTAKQRGTGRARNEQDKL